jgi:hypothetical protein
MDLKSTSRALATFAATALFAAAPAAHAADAIPLSGGVRISAGAVTGELAAPTDSHVQVFSDSWTAAPVDVSTSASLSASDPAGTVRVHGAADARWDSATSGRVSLSDFGWSVEPSGLKLSGTVPYLVGWVGLCGLDCGDVQGVWSYTFTAATDGGFHMTYDIAEQRTGFNFFGDHVWTLSGGDYFSAENTVLPGTGAFGGIPLKAGETYTVSLNSNMSLGGGLYQLTDDVDALFNWQITTQGVPEPSAWTIAITGFGLTGLALRRRSRRRHLAGHPYATE